MSLFYGDEGSYNPLVNKIVYDPDAPVYLGADTPSFMNPNPTSPITNVPLSQQRTVQNDPNRPTWQGDVFQTSPIMSQLERQGYTFVRNNPYGVSGGAGDLSSYDLEGLGSLLAWLETVDWTDPTNWNGVEAPDGTIIGATPPSEVVAQPTPPEDTTPSPVDQGDSSIFADILGNIDFNMGSYDDILGGLGDIFSRPPLQGTTPFVPTPTTGTPTPTTSTPTTGGTGVDIGNESVPASDVVTGGQTGNLDEPRNNIDINILTSLLGNAAAGQAVQSQRPSPTRTSDTIFDNRFKLKNRIQPGLLSPLFRS